MKRILIALTLVLGLAGAAWAGCCDPGSDCCPNKSCCKKAKAK